MSEGAPAAPARPLRCPSCGTEIAPSLIACPRCHALVYRKALESFAAAADAAERNGDRTGAIAQWRKGLPLLPRGSKQYDIVAKKIDALVALAEREQVAGIAKGPAAGTRWAKWLAPLGIAGLLIWKLKFVLVLILTKGKLLLLGFTKAGTLATLFLSFGVYWRIWGWKFAAGLLAAIYVHEMGHVAALRRRGMAAGAPTFIPGFGAFVRMHEHASTPSEDAKIGLAGPRWGLGASLALLLIWQLTGGELWAALAKWSALINLFNLTPVWQLDGSRAFAAFTRAQRIIAIAVLAAAFLATRELTLILVGACALFRVFGKDAPREPDWAALAEYALLGALFSAFHFIPVNV
jgi:Zn-dependent protease